MKRKRILAAVLLAAVCVGGAALRAPGPVLLENGEAETEIGLVIEDENTPMAALPSEGEDAETDYLSSLDDAKSAEVREVLRLVNEARANAGLSPMELNPALCRAAQTRAVECVSVFSHTRPDGTSYKTALTEQGVTTSYVGENVGTGYKNAQRAVSGWLNSEGHRANILNANYKYIGIGLEANTGNRYHGYAWCQLFSD